MWSVPLSKLGTSHSIHKGSSRGSYASRWSWKKSPAAGPKPVRHQLIKNLIPLLFLRSCLSSYTPIPPALPPHTSLALSPRYYSSSSVQPALSNLRRNRSPGPNPSSNTSCRHPGVSDFTTRRVRARQLKSRGRNAPRRWVTWSGIKPPEVISPMVCLLMGS